MTSCGSRTIRLPTRYGNPSPADHDGFGGYGDLECEDLVAPEGETCGAGVDGRRESAVGHGEECVHILVRVAVAGRGAIVVHADQ